MSSEGEQKFLVEAGDVGRRFDHFLADRIEGISRVKVQEAIRRGGATLNGKPARLSEPLRVGDSIEWTPPPPPPATEATPEDIPLEILFEDDALVVLNKPAGLVVHPGAGNVTGTLVSALLFHFGKLGGEALRPGIVHRLDKETSGCLIVAKNDEVHAQLSGQFAVREVKKTYLAVCDGVPRKTFGTIDAPIARHITHRQKMAVATNDRGRDARTEYRLLDSDGRRSLVQCLPLTGRTHQIRLHLKKIGCPICGDPLYGRRGDYTRHLLHAWKISFRHPCTGESLNFEAPPPAEFSFEKVK